MSIQFLPIILDFLASFSAALGLTFVTDTAVNNFEEDVVSSGLRVDPVGGGAIRLLLLDTRRLGSSELKKQEPFLCQ